MEFYSFVAGPLLWIAFLTFIIGSLFKIAIFLFISRKSDRVMYQYFSMKYILISLGRWLLPLNRDIAKNPVFSISGYVFHICLILVPILYSGHIILWEESRFEWSWTPLPDGLSDWLTIIFLAIAIFFFIRRIISSDIRLISTLSDYLLLIATALPFVTGYFSAHGTLDSIQFFNENMYLIHMLSGELVLILIPFTKLSHYILFFFSRSATAIDFGRREYSV